MGTYNLRLGGTAAGDGAKLSNTNPGQLRKFVKEIDFSVTPYTAADVLQLFDMPAGTFVQAVKVQVITAEGDAATADFGLTAVDADGFLDGVDLNSVAHNCSAPATLGEGAPNTIAPAYALGKFFATADSIDMLLNDSLDTAKIRVEVLAWQ